MKILQYAVIIFLASFLLSSPVFAQAVPSPELPPTPSPSQNQIEAEQNAASQDAQGVFGYMIDFFDNFTDKSLAGGLIFTTPDIFPQGTSMITMSDGSQFNNFNTFVQIFTIISASIIAIILAIIGISIAVGDAPFQLMPLLTRFIVTGLLLAGTPFISHQSILGINALNHQIESMGVALLNDKTYIDMNTLSYAAVPIEMMTKAKTQIANGASKPSDFMFPQEQISIFGDFIKSLFVFVFKTIIFVILIMFLILGFLFIVFQFIVRFVSLLFLSLISPLVAPFALSSKTQGVVKAYFMAWISFLIHQPAFLLGYFMVMNIFHGVITSGTVTIGTILMFSGCMLFLGSVNVIITRIFGEPWTAIATNVAAAAAAAPYMGAIFGSIGKVKEGAISGQARGLRQLTGRTLSRRLGMISRDGKDFSFRGVPYLPAQPVITEKPRTTSGPGKNSDASGGTSRNGQQNTTQTRSSTQTGSFTPSLTGEIRAKGVKAEVVNNKTGEVQLNKTPVYAYSHPEKPLVVNYLSKEEALRDGVKPTQLKKTFLEGKFADYSNFYKTGIKNPHNTQVTKLAKNTPYQGKTHIGLTGSEDWVRNHMTVGKDYFKQKEIKGIIGKRSGNNNGTMNENKEKIIRIYTLNE